VHHSSQIRKHTEVSIPHKQEARMEQTGILKQEITFRPMQRKEHWMTKEHFGSLRDISIVMEVVESVAFV